MSLRITRRKFLEKTSGLALAGLAGGYTLAGCKNQSAATPQGSSSTGRTAVVTDVDLVVAKGTSPAKMTKDAVKALGGIEKFVKKGDTVVLSPNLAWARTPEQGANTRPEVIRAAIEMCQEAGAGKILVMDYALDDYRIAFEMNGANSAVQGTPAQLINPNVESMYVDVKLPNGKAIQEDKVLKEVMEAQAVIYLPIAKQHDAAGISMSLKKCMGIIWNRQRYHQKDLHQCIADLSAVVKPSLIIMDATRCLQDHGPKGPGRLTTPNQIVVGTNTVAIDAYGCKYFERQPEEIKHIQLAAQQGVGEMNVSKLKVKEISA